MNFFTMHATSNFWNIAKFAQWKKMKLKLKHVEIHLQSYLGPTRLKHPTKIYEMSYKEWINGIAVDYVTLKENLI